MCVCLSLLYTHVYRCIDPEPPLTLEKDFCGTRIPVTTWTCGPFFGGDNIPIAHRGRLEGIKDWFTPDCVERLLLPFVRRDTSSTHDPDANTSVISLRNIENLL